MRTDAERPAYDPCSPFFASRPEPPNRGIGQKIPLDNKPPDPGMQLLDLDRTGRGRIGPRRANAGAVFRIAARFHVLIRVACPPYFFDNSAGVISSRIASSATLALNPGALNPGEWFFLFFILFARRGCKLHSSPVSP